MFGIKGKIFRAYYKYIKGYDNSDYFIMQLRKKGCIIGNGCRIFTENIGGREPWLIKIGDNSTISNNVLFCTHDNSVSKVDYSELINGLDTNAIGSIYGQIIIGNDCFIGANAIIMYGVTIGDNSIIGAGSVVTKNIPGSEVWGGNPARFLCSMEDFKKKSAKYVFEHKSVYEAKNYLRNNPQKLVKR